MENDSKPGESSSEEVKRGLLAEQRKGSQEAREEGLGGRDTGKRLKQMGVQQFS